MCAGAAAAGAAAAAHQRSCSAAAQQCDWHADTFDAALRPLPLASLALASAGVARQLAAVAPADAQEFLTARCCAAAGSLPPPANFSPVVCMQHVCVRALPSSASRNNPVACSLA